MKFGGYARVSHKPVWSYCGHLNTTSAFFVMRSKLFGLGRTITSRCLDRTCLESWNFLVCHPKTLEIMYAQHVGSRIVHTEYPVPAFFSALLDPKFWDIFPGFSQMFFHIFQPFPPGGSGLRVAASRSARTSLIPWRWEFLKRRWWKPSIKKPVNHRENQWENHGEDHRENHRENQWENHGENHRENHRDLRKRYEKIPQKHGESSMEDGKSGSGDSDW